MGLSWRSWNDGSAVWDLRKSEYPRLRLSLRMFGHRAHFCPLRGKIEVLVPGAGLGRLAFDIAVAGYASQGNEHSFHQLMASNYILNFSPSAHCHTLHPWIHSFSNHRTRASHLRGIQIPDVHPAGLLSNAGDRFSMAAGSFVSAYGTKECEATFDVVATVFFIDTAVNIVDYIETIRNVLRPGGVWINNGPLLWHWEGRDPPPPPAMEEGEGEVMRDEAKGVELTLDEVLVLVEKLGFKVERRMKAEKGEYVGTGDEGMLKYVYEGEFWVAVKV